MYSDDELPYNYYSEAAASKALKIIREHCNAIVEIFYAKLIENPKTSKFLTHSEIERRLKASMVNWLRYTFNYETVREDPQRFRDYQANIGRVHSRVNIGLYLLNYAKVILKRSIFEIDTCKRELDTTTLRYVSDVLDYAVDTLNDSYLSEIVETTRHQQSLRIIASGHQLALDLERSKGEVTAWIKDTIWKTSQGQSMTTKKVDDLNIYHWLKHKGSFTYADEQIRNSMLKHCDDLQRIETAIDETLVGSNPSNKASAIQQLLMPAMRISDQICELLDRIIETILRAEQNTDALTKTLSRRYLSAVAQKEVAFAKQTETAFCVLMIDIDDFKIVNDRHGHRLGDQVLEQVASVLMERIRPGDYVFRYGGEEFLALISETDSEVGAMIAEDIRRRVQALEITISDSAIVNLSISIGVAEYDFHPDFMRTLDKADRRLYMAKNAGKNRVQVID